MSRKFKVKEHILIIVIIIIEICIIGGILLIGNKQNNFKQIFIQNLNNLNNEMTTINSKLDKLPRYSISPYKMEIIVFMKLYEMKDWDYVNSTKHRHKELFEGLEFVRTNIGYEAVGYISCEMCCYLYSDYSYGHLCILDEYIDGYLQAKEIFKEQEQ